ncbi:CheR family methyltransferase [Pyrococcus abyssi]|uniref:protein-glutamate O-methyltransferase n=1 Tax=Pyrococcus abyssi (strain GE5 / Orsay) TaxID=272844 RepID=Q9UYF1_PYRAB|nr:protein-glutamate O-methyltransferase CheR [Pyrococcus abyssi]CAB50461.1 cheR chemotaxis protein methyltransferase [Pyrococcus abyssi GE5]CCE71011.1 TPA: chemotaxis protein methyltransferase [Pyrococcus abyssi GE5]
MQSLRGYELIKAEIFKRLGVDNVNAYKDSYLQRRIRARMRKLGISDYMEYYKLLKQNREEFEELLFTIAINVTEFFRDPVVWKTFQRKVLPELINYKKSKGSRSLKIWSAACSTGQEPYSIAMSLYEVLGDNLSGFRVSILATDIDKEALQIAMKGEYPADAVEKQVPRHMIPKYFDRISDERYRVKPKLKRLVTFRWFNLLSSVYPKGFDVIFIRNVLIYMSKEAQEEIFRKLYDSLEDHGYLILGKTETILGKSANLFKLYDLVAKVYKKNLEVKKQWLGS